MTSKRMAVLKAASKLGRLVLAPLAALLLAVHPAALQLHAATHRHAETAGLDAKSLEKAFDGKNGGRSHGGEKGECPVCKLLGLLASSSFEAPGVEPWDPGWPKAAKTPKALSEREDPSRPLARSSLPRAPPGEA